MVWSLVKESIDLMGRRTLDPRSGESKSGTPTRTGLFLGICVRGREKLDLESGHQNGEVCPDQRHARSY